jgi:Fe2+ or Zn2+ uptake regulation protein
MKKATLDKNVAELKDETKNALQTVYDALNQGQRKKIVKDESVKALFDRYGVEYE